MYAKLTIRTVWLLMGLHFIGTHVKELSTKSAALLTSVHQALLPVHVVHPICCKIETLDLGVTCFKGARGKQSELFWQANIYS